LQAQAEREVLQPLQCSCVEFSDAGDWAENSEKVQVYHQQPPPKSNEE